MTDKPKYDRGYEAAVDEFARVIGRAPETPSTRVVRRPFSDPEGDTMTDTPNRQFELRGFDGQVAHTVSMRVSAAPAPLVMQWRGRTFVYRNNAYSEAATTTLDDDDGVFAPVKRAPTLEDVDAELQPKGLPVFPWGRTGMAWLGNWYADPLLRGVWRRLVIEGPANIATVSVTANDEGFMFVTPLYPPPESHTYPTPEAAQAACEAAIVAAWRNR